MGDGSSNKKDPAWKYNLLENSKDINSVTSNFYGKINLTKCFPKDKIKLTIKSYNFKFSNNRILINHFKFKLRRVPRRPAEPRLPIEREILCLILQIVGEEKQYYKSILFRKLLYIIYCGHYTIFPL